MGKREDAKNRNKERIIAAARELLQSPGGALSMRELADMSGVSVATPYNLFGSKQEVIAAVMDNDLEVLRQSVSDIDGDPIDGFFGVVEVTAGMLATAPDFYRAGARALQGDLNAEMQLQVRAPRHDVLRQLVQNAVQQGYISHRVNIDLFAIQLGQTLMIWTVSWASEFVSLSEFKDQVTYAFGLLLAGIVQEPHRSRVLDITLAAQDRLQQGGSAVGQLPLNVGGQRL